MYEALGTVRVMYEALGTVRNFPYSNCFLDYKITIMICANNLLTFSLQVTIGGRMSDMVR